MFKVFRNSDDKMNHINKKNGRKTVPPPLNMNSSVNSKHGGDHIKRSKNSPPERPNTTTAAEGVYDNGRLMHAVTSLIGSIVQVVVKGGFTYEGVLRTFSPQFEVAVEMVIEVDPKVKNEGKNIGGLLHSLLNKREVHNTMIFKLQDIIMLNVLNVDLDYAWKGSSSGSGIATDTDISKADLNSIKNRLLVPWTPDSCDNHISLEEENNDGSGYDPDEMFKANRRLINAESTYTDDLFGYTTPLVREDTHEFKEREKQAERLAMEIESNPLKKHRDQVENNDDDLSSAVVREQSVNPGRNMNQGQKSRGSRGELKGRDSNVSYNLRNKGGHQNALMSSPTNANPRYHQTNQSHHLYSHHNQHNQPPHSQPYTHPYNYTNKPPSTISPPTSLLNSKLVPNSKDDSNAGKSSVVNQAAVVNTSGPSSSNSSSSSGNVNNNNSNISSGSSVNTSGNQVFSRTGEPKEYAAAAASGTQMHGPPAPLPQRIQSDGRRSGSSGGGSNAPKKRDDVVNETKTYSREVNKLSNDLKEVSIKDTLKESSVSPTVSSPMTTNTAATVASVSMSNTMKTSESLSTLAEPPKDGKKVVPLPSSAPQSPAEPEKLVSPVESETVNSEPADTGDSVAKKSTLNPNAKEFNPKFSTHTRLVVHQAPAGNIVPAHHPVQMPPPQQQQGLPSHNQQPPRIQNPMVTFPMVGQFQILQNPYMFTAPAPFAAPQPANNSRPNYRQKGPQYNGNRQDYSQSTQVAQVTGAPISCTSGQIQIAYNPQQAGNTPQAYGPIYPRMMSPNVQCVSFDPNLHYYTMPPMHLIPQTAVSSNPQVSGPPTPQSGPPSTPLHSGPPQTPPVHHSVAGPQPTQQPTIIYSPGTTVVTHGGQTQGTSATANYINQIPPLLHIQHLQQNISHVSGTPPPHASQAQGPLISAVPPGTIPIVPTSATLQTQGAMPVHYQPNAQNRI